MARTVVRKPKLADAQVLLKLNELQQSERIFNGWYFAQQDFKAKDYKDFLGKYPRGSQGYNDFMAVGHFLEVAGVLLKYGLLSEDVLLELVLDDVDVTVELVELEVVEEVGLLVVELVVCVPL